MYGVAQGKNYFDIQYIRYASNGRFFAHLTLMVKVYVVVVNGGNNNKNTHMIGIEYNYMISIQMAKFMCVIVNQTYSHFKSIIVNSISLDLLKYKIALCLIYHRIFEMKNKDFRLFDTYSIGKGFFQINWAHLTSLLKNDDTLSIARVVNIKYHQNVLMCCFLQLSNIEFNYQLMNNSTDNDNSVCLYFHENYVVFEFKQDGVNVIA